MSALETMPVNAPHHTLVRLQVTGGFLSGANLEFADGLNCFIGGRGAGKTTALEFLRFALGLMPDPKVQGPRFRALDGLVKANLGAGRVSVDLRTKANLLYTAGRAASESVQVVNERGDAVPISLDRDLIFTADVFSQNEIEEMASNPAAQLALLDRFQEQESAAVAREIDDVQRELELSSVELGRLDAEIDDLRAKASEMVAIEERLKGLVEVDGPDADRINAAHEAKALRAREENAPHAIIEATKKFVTELTSATNNFQATFESQLDVLRSEGPNRDILLAIETDTQHFRDDVTSARSALESAARAAASAISTGAAQLAERHATQEAAYRALVSETEERGGRAAERTSLQAAYSTALAAHNHQQAKEKQRDTQQKERTQRLATLSDLRDKRFQLRKTVAERLSQQFPTIRVTVTQGADLEAYKDLLTESLKGIGIKNAVAADRIAQVLLPTELAHLVSLNDHSTLTERTGLDEERTRKILLALRSTGVAFRLESVDVADRPCIELRDGDTFKESAKLSTGQRCTTILPILLVQSERPLLIDQPEDNLDNAFVYDTIVKALRDVKGGRQVIFVTHNPNIPVLGEAERIFVFESDGQRATLRRAGSVDDCKEEIERILEGGREAFLRRKVRYGH